MGLCERFRMRLPVIRTNGDFRCARHHKKLGNPCHVTLSAVLRMAGSDAGYTIYDSGRGCNWFLLHVLPVPSIGAAFPSALHHFAATSGARDYT